MENRDEIELKTEDQLWDFLNDLYLLEVFDDANMYEAPINASWDALDHLKSSLPEGYNFQSKIIDNNGVEIAIGEYIAEFDDYGIMSLNWDGEYLTPNN